MTKYQCVQCEEVFHYEDEIVYFNYEGEEMFTQDAHDYGYEEIKCTTCAYNE